LRLLRVVEDRLLAVDQETARVRPVDAGENLHERGLPRSVLADEAVHLAGVQLDVAVHEGVHGAEALLRVLEREQCWAGRRGHVVRSGAPTGATPPTAVPRS